MSAPLTARRQYAIAGLIIVAGVLPLSAFVRGLLANILSLASFLLALVLCVRVNHGISGWTVTLPARIHRSIAGPLAVLWLLFALTTSLTLSVAGMLRLPAYLLTSAGCAFIIPVALARERAYRVFAIAGALLALVGLPGVFFGTISIGPFTLPAIAPTSPLLGAWDVHNPASVFAQPNQLALLATVGLFSALTVIYRTRIPRNGAVFALAAGICAVCVIVTRSRAIWGAIVAVVALYAVYRASARNSRVLAAATVLGTVCAMGVFAAVAGVLPEPFVIDVTLNNRSAAWAATIEAFARRPLVGWGPGNTVAAITRTSTLGKGLTGSSYLRMFAMTGVIGGITYLVLCANAVRCALSRIHYGSDTDTEFATLALLAVVLLTQAFQGLTLFGLALLSVLGMLFVGYAQPNCVTTYVFILDSTGLSYTQEKVPNKPTRKQHTD